MDKVIECFVIMSEIKKQNFTNREEIIVKLSKHLPGKVEEALKLENEGDRNASFGIIGLMVLEFGKQIIEITEKNNN